MLHISLKKKVLKLKWIKFYGVGDPKNASLAYLIDKYNLHPITSLTSLSSKQKQYLLNNGLILCKDVPNKYEILKELRLKENQIKKIIHDAKLVCSNK